MTRNEGCLGMDGIEDNGCLDAWLRDAVRVYTCSIVVHVHVVSPSKSNRDWQLQTVMW